MQVKLKTKTIWVEDKENVTIDEILVAQARVSSNKTGNELFDKPEKLIRYMILGGHWSPFDMANFGVEITTSRAIGREILRHWSIHPQEFSQRYSSVVETEAIELRLQASGNRQSSSSVTHEYDELIEENISGTLKLYEYLVENGVAKETARFILPETTSTKLYLNGTVRSWITFLNARLHKTAQKEIRDIAEEIKDIFIDLLPITSKALYNFENAYEVPILDQLIINKYK